MSTKDLRLLGFTLENRLLRIETILQLHDPNLSRHLPVLRASLDEVMGIARLLQIAGHEYGQRRTPAVDPVPDPAPVVILDSADNTDTRRPHAFIQVAAPALR